MTTGSNPISYADRPNTPLRGTQSLVGVMSFVFKHPSLTVLELLWRWLAAAPLLYLAWRALAPTLEAIPLNTTALQSMTFLEPVRSATVLARQLLPFRSPLEATGKWWIPLAIAVWTAAATLGRTALLGRANRLWKSGSQRAPAYEMSSRPEAQSAGAERSAVHSARAEGSSLSSANLSTILPQTALYTLLRILAFLTLLTLWLYGLLSAVRSTVTHRLYANAEPNLVLLTAEAVALTLAAFLLWSITVWLLDLRPLQALTGLQTQTKQLRAKLIETNLVMGIVRVILLVLALTFSASPLPFQSRDTQAFINVWWVATAAFYILSSDFFHVVRRVTYLRLLQSIAFQANTPTPSAS